MVLIYKIVNKKKIIFFLRKFFLLVKRFPINMKYSQDVSGVICLFIIVVVIIFFTLTRFVEEFKKEDPMLYKIKNKLRPLSPDTVDNVTFLEDTKSYTINKKKVYLCLKDENGEYYDDNMLMFVAIHEMAHVLCDEIGHTDKFQKIFQELLDKASGMGIYDPSVAPIQNYCEY